MSGIDALNNTLSFLLANMDNYDITPQPQSDKIVLESKAPPVDTVAAEGPRNEWPFETVCEHLCMDLFDPSWEIRHGAGIGLRSVLKNQGKGAAKTGKQLENE
jgi:TATA-binding protein-associated factor